MSKKLYGRIFCVLMLFVVLSCEKSMVTTAQHENLSPQPVELNGKWLHKNQPVKVFFEEEINKIVLSDGCQVVSANYQRFAPAIAFSSITATQKTCDHTVGLDDILKHTIFLQAKSSHQLVFLNENREEMLVVEKF